MGPFGLYIDAFNELSSCRPSGFGLSAIPFVAILEYAKLYEITGEDFDEFLYIIRTMDSELIRLETTKQKQNGPKGNKRNSGKN